MIKADLHLHSNDDRTHNLKYDSKELIDYMAKKGFEVMALTFHGHVYYNKDLANYAKKKGVLLISGIEKMVEGKEVLIYNITDEQSKKIKTFKDLKEFKKKHDCLIIAPHPFFKTKECLGDKLEENIDLFDAIEYSHYYFNFFNMNNKAVKIAEKYNKPMFGNSDTHFLEQIGMTYSLVDSKKDIKSVFNAIKKGRVDVISKQMSLYYFIWRTTRMILKLE